MEDYNALYKISEQLTLRMYECRHNYEEDVILLGEDHPNTKHWKDRLEEAEEAVKIFDELKAVIAEYDTKLKGGEADAK